MVSAHKVIKVARSQVGYVEKGGSGHDGNITKYWAELDPAFQGASWCAAFVSWVFKHAGKPLPAIDHPFGYTYCPDAVNWAKSHGLWNASGHYKPGDIILYSWDGSGVAEHTGIVVKDEGSAGIHTIEGNTSPNDAGSQSNGGGVYAKVRFHGPTVLGVLEAHKWLGVSGVVHHRPKPSAVQHNPYAKAAATCKRGSTGEKVRFVQWAVGVKVDGQYGPVTQKAVDVFQHHHPKCGKPSGQVNSATLAVLKGVTH